MCTWMHLQSAVRTASLCREAYLGLMQIPGVLVSIWIHRLLHIKHLRNNNTFFSIYMTVCFHYLHADFVNNHKIRKFKNNWKQIWWGNCIKKVRYFPHWEVGCIATTTEQPNHNVLIRKNQCELHLCGQKLGIRGIVNAHIDLHSYIYEYSYSNSMSMNTHMDLDLHSIGVFTTW